MSFMMINSRYETYPKATFFNGPEKFMSVKIPVVEEVSDVNYYFEANGHKTFYNI